MKDETYSFISDVKEKGTVARSSHNRRSHTGKGGRCRLPHDNLSKKELQKMNGECKAYSLNSPMTREQFQEMPKDLRAVYIKAIRNKYGTPDSVIAKAMGFSQQAFSQNVIKKLGLALGKRKNGNTKWDKEGFYAWWNGVDKLPTPVPEAEPIQEEAPESFVEDDLPFEDSAEENVGDNRILLPSPLMACTASQHKPIPQTACPNTGSLSFKCPANIALNTMTELLQNEMVAISITWRVVEEGGDDDD